MSYTRKSFSGNAVATTLSAAIGSTDLTIQVGATTGFPNTATGPFIVTVDRGTPSEEKVEISSYTSTTLTVSSGGRGVDGTTALAHSSGADLRHTFDAGTINTHEAALSQMGTVTPAASAVGDAASDGSSAIPAAADHKHAREAFATGATSASAPADTENDGTSLSPARADHKHARESVSTLVTDVSPFIAGLPVGLTGATGATAATRYVGGTVSGAPTSGTFLTGDFVIDQSGFVWICTTGGTPGTWKGGPGTSLAGHLASNYSLTTSLATFLTTPLLSVGTWDVTFKGLAFAEQTDNEFQASAGTATATLEGATSDQQDCNTTFGGGTTSVVGPINMKFIATVTVAGTLVFQGWTSDATNGPLVLAATSSSNHYPKATGFTAVKLP